MAPRKPIVGLAWREHRLDGVAKGIDERVDFGRQPAAGSANRLFTVFSRPGAMLVSAHDGGVDHHVFVVMIARQ
jgi:hypothetical protein